MRRICVFSLSFILWTRLLFGTKRYLLFHGSYSYQSPRFVLYHAWPAVVRSDRAIVLYHAWPAVVRSDWAIVLHILSFSEVETIFWGKRQMMLIAAFPPSLHGMWSQWQVSWRVWGHLGSAPTGICVHGQITPKRKWTAQRGARLSSGSSWEIDWIQINFRLGSGLHV